AAISLGITAGLTSKDRRSVALRATVVGMLILLAFTFFGSTILGVLGISMPAFRVAGGLLLFYISAEMVFAVREDRRSKPVDKATSKGLAAKDLQAMAVFPLAVPLVAGPGAISATILLSEQFSSWEDRLWLTAILLSVGLMLYLSLLLADRLDRFIGDSGRAVLTRLLGILLAALSVQFIADGAKQLFS
ncbi:MAG: MarC family protein, partial [Pseudomonadota bacterium]